MTTSGTPRSIAVAGYQSPIDIYSIAVDGYLISVDITPKRFTCPPELLAVLDCPGFGITTEGLDSLIAIGGGNLITIVTDKDIASITIEKETIINLMSCVCCEE